MSYQVRLDTEKESGSGMIETGGNPAKTDTNATEEEKKQVEQERTRIKKALFLVTFGKTLGAVSATCQEIGINRDTFYEWKRNDPKFLAGLHDCERQKLEDVEQLAAKEMMKGNSSLIRHFLDRRHPLYRPRVKVEGPVAGEKSLEEELDEMEFVDEDSHYGETENKNDGTGIDSDQNQAPKQEGTDSPVQVESGSGVLLEKKDEAKCDSESPAEGNQQDNPGKVPGPSNT